MKKKKGPVLLIGLGTLASVLLYLLPSGSHEESTSPPVSPPRVADERLDSRGAPSANSEQDETRTALPTIELSASAESPPPEDVEANEPAATTQQSSPDSLAAEGGPETWAASYEAVPGARMLKEAEKITDYLKEQTAEELRRLREEGEFEVVSTGRVYIGSDEYNEFYPGMDVLITDYGRTTRRYRVSEERYPDLWHLAKKAKWLQTNGIPKSARERNSRSNSTGR